MNDINNVMNDIKSKIGRTSRVLRLDSYAIIGKHDINLATLGEQNN